MPTPANDASGKPSQNIEIVLHYVEEVERERIPGTVVECGVYQGASLAAIAARLKDLGSSREIVGFDSFEGLPEPAEADRIEDPALRLKARRGYFGDTSLEDVRARIAAVGYGGQVRLVPGWFDDTLPQYQDAIGLLFLDCDFYDSYKIALRYLWPRVVPRGYVIFDEYDSLKYPGARRAVDEYFRDLPEKPQTDLRFTGPTGFRRWFVRRQPPVV